MGNVAKPMRCGELSYARLTPTSIVAKHPQMIGMLESQPGPKHVPVVLIHFRIDQGADCVNGLTCHR